MSEETSSIFVSIASYRDNELIPTLRSIVDNSSGEHPLHLSVHSQSNKDECPNLRNEYPSHVRLTHTHSALEDSHGVGWARSIAQKPFADEDYYLQVDSHVQLTKDWDRILIAQHAAASSERRAVITAYLPGYTLVNGQRTISSEKPTKFKISRKNGYPYAEPVTECESLRPTPTDWFAGGFAFSSKDFVTLVPYDPEIFFFGEEITMGIRAFSAGFDLYCPGRFVGAHLYDKKSVNENDRIRQHRFWDKADDRLRAVPWHERNKTSMRKVAAICRGEWFGVFGITNNARYEIFRNSFKTEHGIDLKQCGVSDSPAENESPSDNVNRWKGEKARGRVGELIVVGVGIRAISQITLEAIAHIQAADIVFYNPTSAVMSSLLQSLNKNCFNLKRFYGEGKFRQITYIQMADALMREVRAGAKVVAVFHGHPGFFVSAARQAITHSISEGYRTKMLPGISSFDNLCADLRVDPGALGLQIVKAGRYLVGKTTLNVMEHVVIVQPGAVGDRTYSFIGKRNTKIAQLVEKLRHCYGDNQEVVIYKAATVPGQKAYVKTISLNLLCGDPNKEISPGSSLYIPPKGTSHKQVVARQSSINARPKMAFGKAIYTPPLEMAPLPVGYTESVASPALFRMMASIAKDARELEIFERDPQAYFVQHTKLVRGEEHLFR